MMRKSAIRFFFLAALVTVGAAYGCGSGESGAPGDGGGLDAPGEAALGGDGSLDGSAGPDGPTNNAVDATSEAGPRADAGAEADAPDGTFEDAYEGGALVDAGAADAPDARGAIDATDAADAAEAGCPAVVLATTLIDIGADGGAVLDPSFGAQGLFASEIAGPGDAGPFSGGAYIVSITSRPDGRVVALAKVADQARVIQVLANGSGLDPSFGAGLGYAPLPPVFSYYWNTGGQKLAVQADGKIVLAGICDDKDLCVLRLDATGAVDTHFGSGGIARTTLPGRESYAIAIFIDAVGRAVVTGGSFGLSTSSPSADDALVARFTVDGAPDATFGVGGLVRYLPAGASVYATYEGDSVAVQSSGRVVVLAKRFDLKQPSASVVKFLVLGLTPDGVLDPSFGGGPCEAPGTRVLDFGNYDYPSALALGADDSVFVAGVLTGGPSSNMAEAVAVGKLTTDGALDPSFAGGALLRITDGESQFEVYAASRVGSSYYVAAWVDDYSTGRPLLLKVRADGTLDPAFGSGGVGHLPFTNGLHSFVVGAGNGRALIGGERVIDLGSGTEDYVVGRLIP